ncbi:MAG: hypoxanthine phosphoribosyltransferase [Bacteroidota bacterium]
MQHNIIQVKDLRFEPYLLEADIQRRIQLLALQIERDYQGKHPLFIGVLNGAFVFIADLLRYCNLDCDISFVKLSSYSGTQSSGQVREIIGLDQSVKDRHIIIVEDIVDTGKTMHHFMQQLQTERPASVALATLLSKPSALEHPVSIDYLGFEIENQFVIGYGLDYNGAARNLKDIYQLATTTDRP